MAEKESAASQEKSGGPQEARASVSFGSAEAGERKVTQYFKNFLVSYQNHRVRGV